MKLTKSDFMKLQNIKQKIIEYLKSQKVQIKKETLLQSNKPTQPVPFKEVLNDTDIRRLKLRELEIQQTTKKIELNV